MSLNRLKLGMRKKDFIKPLAPYLNQKGRQTPIDLIQKNIKNTNNQRQLKENHNPESKSSNQIVSLQQSKLELVNLKTEEQLSQTIEGNVDKVQETVIELMQQTHKILNQNDPNSDCNDKQRELISVTKEQKLQDQRNSQTALLQSESLSKITQKNVETDKNQCKFQTLHHQQASTVNKVSDSTHIFLQQSKKLNQSLEQKRKQIDQLVFQNKKMQIKLMNANQAYYEKQIKRLKQEVQKLQDNNQQFKHQYFESANNQKQLQANLTSKTQQLSTLIKQFQKQKIINAELTHQVSQKDLIYKKIIGQLQKSQTQISNKFEEVNAKYHQVDGLCRQKQVELDTLQKRYEASSKALQESERKIKNNKQNYECQINKIRVMMSQFELTKRSMQRQSQATIQRLSEDLRMISQQRQSFVLLNSQRYSQIQNQNQKVSFQIQIVRLEEQLKQSEQLNETYKITISQITQKFKSYLPKTQYDALQKQYKNLNQKRIDAAKFYQNKLALIQKHNEQLALKLKSQFTLPTQQQHKKNKDSNFSFHEALKSQISEADKFKNEILKKTEQIYITKQSLEEVNQKYQQLKIDFQIMNKQQRAKQQNKKIQKEISQQNLQNDIDSLKRKFFTMQKKLQSKARENKQKQEFITNYIIGKSHEATYLVKQLQRIFMEAQKNSEKV